MEHQGRSLALELNSCEGRDRSQFWYTLLPNNSQSPERCESSLTLNQAVELAFLLQQSVADDDENEASHGVHPFHRMLQRELAVQPREGNSHAGFQSAHHCLLPGTRHKMLV